ncbi:hypothetical protein AKJ47_00875 [candidate division MSBL1 archaeon SCGC-AAA261G05]|uniref:Probable ribosomal RNA small subunit methyltransferase A n=2 Tax=candidate division MSBL1 TaxID=215777 RepID=A0A133V1H8_9EURY|nr:hypothetical protein AKJ42_01065 [candidate division MSBL1 archaeon SCGC-AAA261C02]KXB04080.1 hypothetical protein AKJ47_00875 [candidate division MSBL1 archaeon SCGC-AAA261G05]
MLRDFTKKILREHDIRLRKKSGQSQIIDEEVLERLVEPGKLSQEDTILEIGPGIGNLTDLLIQRAGRVIAIENDERLVKVLDERFSDVENLEVIQGDALEVDFPDFDKIISNLPFSISSEITFKILRQDFKLGVLMYQREFAQRMTASSGSSDYGRLSVNVFYRAKVEEVGEVPSSAFIPQPEVNSTILKLELREPPFKVDDEGLFSRVLRAAFQHRRQKVRNALIHSFKVMFPGSSLPKAQQREFVDEHLPTKFADSRPADLSPEDFGEITNILTELGHELQD